MKLVLITGGSKGLGRSLTEKYLSEDFEVYEFSRTGRAKSHIKCDFSFPVNSAKIIDETLYGLSNQDYSEIILINNVGRVNPIGPISEYEADQWINHININFSASIITSGIFIKHFQGFPCKKIISFISSGAAVKSKYGWSLYCASKAGIEHFCQTLAIEQTSQKYPIDMVIINPGIIDTDMQADIRNTDQSLFPDLSRFVDFKNSEQLASPQTVAEKVYNTLSSEIKNGEKFSMV